jgi:hypothetical protein
MCAFSDSTASWRLDGLSVKQDSSSTVRILLGQYWGCDQASNWLSPSTTVRPAARELAAPGGLAETVTDLRHYASR